LCRAFSGKRIAKQRNVTCHMESHSVIRYKRMQRHPALTQSIIQSITWAFL